MANIIPTKVWKEVTAAIGEVKPERRGRPKKYREYPFREIGPRPNRLILHRNLILKWLDLDRHVFHEIVTARLLPWKQLYPDGFRYYRRDDVERVLLNRRKPQSGAVN